jgi:NTP pyrophosphatase (non-canonical NTP hydrolase)
MKTVIDRINILTSDDLQYKTPIQLAASAIEEIGELTREIKIEEKIPGNAHKQPDEGSKAETVDLFICAICLACTHGVKIKPIWENTLPQADIFLLLRAAMIDLGECFKMGFLPERDLHNSINDFIQDTINIFFNRGGTIEEFEQIAHKKLDKWEKTKGK